MIEPERPLRRNREYLALLGGQTVSGIGISMSMFVFPLVVLQATGSTLYAGLAGGLVALADWMFTLPAGALVDRWNRRTVMLASEVIRALLFASLVGAGAFGQLELVHLLVVAFLSATVGTFFGPAETAALPHVVLSSQLPTAIANNQARQSAAALVGSPLGGAMLALGRLVPFGVTAATYAVSALALLLIRTDLRAPASTAQAHLLREIREGLGYVWSSAFMRVVLAMAMLANLGATGLLLVVNLNLYASGVAPVAIGAIDTVAGVAAVGGSLLAGRVVGRVRLGVIAIVVFWVWAVAMIPVPLTNNVILIGALLGLGMFVSPIGNAALLSHWVATTPDRLQGRAISALTFSSQAVTPLAPLMGGWLLAHTNRYVAMYVFVGLLVLIAVLVTASRSIRALPRIA